MELALRLCAAALVPLLIVDAVLWWPISKYAPLVAIALICSIPRALRWSLDA